jgi:hypothetical protein
LVPWASGVRTVSSITDATARVAISVPCRDERLPVDDQPKIIRVDLFAVGVTVAAIADYWIDLGAAQGVSTDFVVGALLIWVRVKERVKV